MSPSRPPAAGRDRAAREGEAAGYDAWLAEFLHTTDEARGGAALAELIEGGAMPVLRRVLERKFGRRLDRDSDVEDCVGEAREHLIERLLTLRAQAQERRPDQPPGEPPIRDLPGYAAALAYAAWSRRLSRLQPARALLGNQLRHLLEDRRGLRGFACWHGPTGERWCGLARWKPAAGAAAPAAPDPEAAARAQRLMDEPDAAAHEALEGGADAATCELARLLEAIFRWVGGPIEWHDLSGALARVRDADQPLEIAGENAAAAARQVVDALPDAHDQLRWREYLTWLWRSAGELPPRQCMAYVLHSHAVFEWEAAGVASARDVAILLKLPPVTLAQLWSRLPLDDLTIAQMLSSTRQQVINLRRVARDTLGRAWQQCMAEGSLRSPATHRPRQVISESFPARP